MWTIWPIRPKKATIGHKLKQSSQNHPLGEKVQNSNYKYNQQKNTSLFSQNQLRIHQSENHFINAISDLPRTKATKSTPTKARSPSQTTHTPIRHQQQTTRRMPRQTPSANALDTAEDLRLTDTINEIFSKKLLTILNRRDAILKEVWDFVIRNDEERLKKISPYIYS